MDKKRIEGKCCQLVSLQDDQEMTTTIKTIITILAAAIMEFKLK